MATWFLWCWWSSMVLVLSLRVYTSIYPCHIMTATLGGIAIKFYINSIIYEYLFIVPCLNCSLREVASKQTDIFWRSNIACHFRHKHFFCECSSNPMMLLHHHAIYQPISYPWSRWHGFQDLFKPCPFHYMHTRLDTIQQPFKSDCSPRPINIGHIDIGSLPNRTGIR